MSEEKTGLMLGSIPSTQPAKPNQRMSMILWGSAGCGKTTLACTAPGKKLLLNFDPDGPTSVTGFPDVHVADLSSERHGVVDRMKGEDPLGLRKFIEENGFDTIIVDSMTSLAEIATTHAVSNVAKATQENPTLQGYQYRNSYMLQMTMALLRLTNQLGKHIIFIAHEDAPVTNDEGVVLYITMTLGGKLNERVPLQLSEVWAITDTGRERRIAIRPVRGRKPMKSRMFITSGDPEFKWNFDPMTMKGDTITDWYEKWKAGNFQKIAVPK